VLFIHGDSDKIIDTHHSVMMHDARRACGLPSVLHIQQSSPEFKRGHNYFDYQADMVAPMQAFLREHVPVYTRQAAIAVPVDRLDAACVVPRDFQMETAALPPQQHDMTERGHDHDQQKESAPTGGSSTTVGATARASDSDHRTDTRGRAQDTKDSDNDKNDGEDSSCFSSLPSCRCLLCPCALCCEGCLSCALTGLAAAADVVHPPSASGAFRYQTKAQRGQEHLTTAKIVCALLTSKNVIAGFVVEEVPVHMRDR
jgi:hypothetical protein